MAAARVNDTGAEARPVELTDGLGNTITLKNVETLTLLASAARTATTASALQTNKAHRGVLIHINVTVAGTGNITFYVRHFDPISGAAKGIGNGGVASTATYYGMMIYPGAAAGLDAAYPDPLPLTWDVLAQKSDGSSWTFSVAATLLP